MKSRSKSRFFYPVNKKWHSLSKYLIYSLLWGTLVISLNSCLFSYSFSGASIPANVKTLFVDNFQNNATLGPANLGQDFTDRLREYYQQNSSLNLVDGNGDWSLKGNITSYTVAPIALTAQSQAASNRLTIAVSVTFESKNDDTKNFTETFSQFADFPQTQTLAQAEPERIPEIFEKLLLDIFNKTAANW